MEMDSGKELKGILILDNGKIAKPKVMEFIYGKMETSMKVNGKLA